MFLLPVPDFSLSVSEQTGVSQLQAGTLMFAALCCCNNFPSKHFQQIHSLSKGLV